MSSNITRITKQVVDSSLGNFTFKGIFENGQLKELSLTVSKGDIPFLAYVHMNSLEELNCLSQALKEFELEIAKLLES